MFEQKNQIQQFLWLAPSLRNIFIFRCVSARLNIVLFWCFSYDDTYFGVILAMVGVVKVKQIIPNQFLSHSMWTCKQPKQWTILPSSTKSYIIVDFWWNIYNVPRTTSQSENRLTTYLHTSDCFIPVSFCMNIRTSNKQTNTQQITFNKTNVDLQYICIDV